MIVMIRVITAVTTSRHKLAVVGLSAPKLLNLRSRPRCHHGSLSRSFLKVWEEPYGICGVAVSLPLKDHIFGGSWVVTLGVIQGVAPFYDTYGLALGACSLAYH